MESQDDPHNARRPTCLATHSVIHISRAFRKHLPTLPLLRPTCVDTTVLSHVTQPIKQQQQHQQAGISRRDQTEPGSGSGSDMPQRACASCEDDAFTARVCFSTPCILRGSPGIYPSLNHTDKFGTQISTRVCTTHTSRCSTRVPIRVCPTQTSFPSHA